MKGRTFRIFAISSCIAFIILTLIIMEVVL
ncbi:hypothetical protein Ga0123461_2021 [Mariprofundus aestuarium]|uniref:Uncharacterized protein n=1 Tax=Mariprofundus aestuarium TaxID=1921086 RepID=A0A2K8KZJ8_MARES|nr:hypothetical protein Ga0123461_2021 [Mariprofundus aestuarium]